MPESKKSRLKYVALALLWQMWRSSVWQKTPESKKSSLKSVALAVHQYKNEVPDKESVMVKKVGEMKTPKKQ